MGGEPRAPSAGKRCGDTCDFGREGLSCVALGLPAPAPTRPMAFSADSNPHTSPSTHETTELALEGVWRVVVLNDPVNLMSYVVMVFKKVLGFDEATARRHMLEVHEQGRSVVWSGLREKAEAYAFTLQQWHLSVVLEPDEAH